MDTHRETPLLALRGIRKVFPGVRALESVDLTVNAGEVHALTGENGSGKSTLASVINGSLQPDDGTMELDGQEQRFAAPAQALDAGIVTITQELTLAPTLTVAENIYLGRLPKGRFGRVDWPRLRRAAQETLERLGFEIDPRRRVAELNIEHQQEVEIARAVAAGGRLLILDEATSALSENATRRVLEIIEQERAQGMAVLMISHRMPEIYAAASRATVLRDGRVVGTLPLPETPESVLVSRMVGRELGDYYGRRRRKAGDVVLEVSGLASYDGRLRPTSLRVRSGEILGVAGLVGSGKAELGLALGGAIPSEGTVSVGGKPVSVSNPRAVRAAGIGFVPDDRKRAALFPTRSVGENLSMAWLDMLSRRGFIRVGAEKSAVNQAIERYGIVTRSHASPITTLSGGNQQKVVLGRVFDLGVDVLVLNEPTRGIDVGAKSEIYHLMSEAADRGTAVVLISSELPELIGNADRIAVFFRGELRQEFAGEEMQEDSIAHVAVTGVQTNGPDAGGPTEVTQ